MAGSPTAVATADQLLSTPVPINQVPPVVRRTERLIPGDLVSVCNPRQDGVGDGSPAVRPPQLHIHDAPHNECAGHREKRLDAGIAGHNRAALRFGAYRRGEGKSQRQGDNKNPFHRVLYQ